MAEPELKSDIDELIDEFEDSEEDISNEFDIRHPLAAPSANLVTTQSLHTLIHEGVIDLNPPYQRDVVWSETKQIQLINSVFHNYYIPPVIFAKHIDSDGEEVRVCVDGKQRLTSIQKFFDGQIPYKDPLTKKSYWYTRPESHKNTRLDIPVYWKGIFAEKQITCVEYSDLKPGTERDIFQRVQLGMTLTTAEKLQAHASPWAEWIGELQSQHVISEDGLASIIEWDTKRGVAFQNLAHFIYCCDSLPNRALPTASKTEKWIVRVDPPTQNFKKKIADVLRSLWHIASTDGLNKGFTSIQKKVAPVEFIFICVLLFVMRESYSVEDCAAAILNMRRHVRARFTDVRNNNTVAKELWLFIQSITNPESVVLDTLQISPIKRSKKRRKGDLSDNDDDYKPEPVKHLGKITKTRAKR